MASVIADGQGLAVRAERDRFRALAAGVDEGSGYRQGGEVQQVGAAIYVAGGQGFAVGTERYRVSAVKPEAVVQPVAGISHRQR